MSISSAWIIGKLLTGILLSLQTFLVGQTISGCLHFTLTEPKSYKQIFVNLHGRALVKWTETRTSGSGRHTHTYTVAYRAEETYVNTSVLLWSDYQSSNGKIGPGTFNLPFQLEIPSNCFGSFEGRYGNIRYSIQGHIKTGRLKFDHTISIPITVNRKTDINISRLLVPAHRSRQKQVGFFCFGTNVEFTASLSRTGFCIGHSLPLTVNVVNGSGRRIKMRASIQRFCMFHAQGHTRHTREKVAVILSPHISAHSQYTWQEGGLVVPMLEPSFTESQIIKIQYYLKVTAVIPWASNSSVLIPITLGNVPPNSY